MTGTHVLAVSDPLSAPTWLTAVFTGVLGAGAIVTAIFAILAFRKQSAEVRLLQDQAEHDQAVLRQEAGERRRERAALVYLTVDFDWGSLSDPEYETPARDTSVTAIVHNSGRQPAYDTRLHWVDATSGMQAGLKARLGTIAPHNKESARRTFPFGTEQSPLIPVAYFRDAAGIAWTLLENGELEEVAATQPAGAPVIATHAILRSKKRAENEARLRAALTEHDAAAPQDKTR